MVAASEEVGPATASHWAMGIQVASGSVPPATWVLVRQASAVASSRVRWSGHHVIAADCTLHLEFPSISEHNEARGMRAKELIHCIAIVEDDKAKATVVPRWGGEDTSSRGAMPLQPGLLHT
eukprot:CAMPEP_0179188324 /NCGR_PEP_ID=MMETSP0796-20121207/93466_1 /TAXON_ID=73915 /ORGANISM="Pyrodinium bahamense, Strain pbaha01" /LENGTH=121 /DNA_ID=CAMNT_0020892421 /DNA_START=809 /DNA_END=1175 /DNA_ORIENTATION=-